MFTFNVRQEERGNEEEEDPNEVRKRLESLKKKHRDGLYTMLSDEVDQYTKLLNLYEEEMKHLRRENEKKIKSKNIEIQKLKNGMIVYILVYFFVFIYFFTVSAAQNLKILLECSNSLSRLNLSIQKDTELQKELYQQGLADFERYIEKCDQDEDKLFSKRIKLMDDLKASLTDEEFSVVQEYVKKQTELVETQYQKQVKELEVPEAMINILSESKKSTDLVHKDVEQMHNEVTTLFDNIFSMIPKIEKVITKQDKLTTIMESEDDHAVLKSADDSIILSDSAVAPNMSMDFAKNTENGANATQESDGFMFENETKQEKQKLTTKIESADFAVLNSADDSFIMPDSSAVAPNMSMAFGNTDENLGDNEAIPESDGFMFDFGDKDDDNDQNSSFNFNF